MFVGDIGSKIDALWNAFWTGGSSNPFEVIEQITYLLFLNRLDDQHTLEENKASRLNLKKLERRVFPEGNDPKGCAYKALRCSRARAMLPRLCAGFPRATSFPPLSTALGLPLSWPFP